MKKILKKEVVIAFIVGIIFASSIAVYASTINASNVDYKNGKTVEYALNDLYGKLPKGSTTITSNGENINIKQYESINVNVDVMGTKTLLWSNPNSNLEFSAQDITLNSSYNNFSHLLVKFRYVNSSSKEYEIILPLSEPSYIDKMSEGLWAIAAMTATGEQHFRICGLYSNDENKNKIRFGSCWKSKDGTDAINANCIPTYIYGLDFSY